MSTPDADFFTDDIARRMAQTPFMAGIGASVVEFEDGRACIRLPYSDRLVGDPDTGVLHGGVISGLLDQCCGMAVGRALREHRPFATLDLRIDYMKAAKPGADIFVEAECLKVAHEVAFARGIAYQESKETPIALATGTFMMTTMPFPATGAR